MDEIKNKHVAYWKMMYEDSKKMAGQISTAQIAGFEHAWLTIRRVNPDLEELRTEWKRMKHLEKEGDETEKQIATVVLSAINKLADHLKDPENFSFFGQKKWHQASLFS